MPNKVERFRLREVPSPGVGAALLDCVHAFLGGLSLIPTPRLRDAHTLWIAYAHLMGIWNATPRIAFLFAGAVQRQDASARSHCDTCPASGRRGQRDHCLYYSQSCRSADHPAG